MALLHMHAVWYDGEDGHRRIALFETEDARDEFVATHDGECEVDKGRMGVMYSRGLVEKHRQEREEQLGSN